MPQFTQAAAAAPGEQMRYFTSFCNQSDRGAIEAGEDLAAAPSAFEGDSTVSKVAAGGQHRKASLDGWPVRRARALPDGRSAADTSPLSGRGRRRGASTLPCGA